MQSDTPTQRRFRFSLRKVLVFMALIAFLIGWYNSLGSARREKLKLYQQLVDAKMQMQLVESRVAFLSNRTPSLDPTTKGVLSEESLEGMNLRDVVLQSDTAAFQQTSFDNSDLTNASLTGGHASFQGATFNNAILKNAKLTGGASSFQYAYFVNADLSGAILAGNFQVMSLANASCVGTTIKGSFQGVNIDATQFQQADLSAISRNSLESCFFDTPPVYDARTKFPEDFDPTANGWKRAQ